MKERWPKTSQRRGTSSIELAVAHRVWSCHSLDSRAQAAAQRQTLNKTVRQSGLTDVQRRAAAPHRRCALPPRSLAASSATAASLPNRPGGSPSGTCELCALSCLWPQQTSSCHRRSSGPHRADRLFHLSVQRAMATCVCSLSRQALNSPHTCVPPPALGCGHWKTLPP